MSSPGNKTYAAASVPGSWTDLVTDYERFAKRYRSILPATIEQQKTYLSRFYSHTQARCPSKFFASLSPASIQRFVFQYAKHHGPGSRQWMQTALRAFLRFCHHRQYLGTDLSNAVPSVHRRRLASVPKAVEETAVEQLLDAIDTSSPLGMRDHAVIQLLHTYGVRGIHVRNLRLPHIHWRESRRMVDNQIPFKVIGDMLGHRDPTSTFIYSKVDLQALRQAALDWPPEVSP